MAEIERRQWQFLGALATGGLVIGLIVYLLALNISQNQRRIDNLHREVSEVKAMAESINADRHKRTVIIQGFVAKDEDHDHVIQELRDRIIALEVLLRRR